MTALAVLGLLAMIAGATFAAFSAVDFVILLVRVLIEGRE